MTLNVSFLLPLHILFLVLPLLLLLMRVLLIALLFLLFLSLQLNAAAGALPESIEIDKEE